MYLKKKTIYKEWETNVKASTNISEYIIYIFYNEVVIYITKWVLISCLVDAMMAIKTKYQVNKNWMGDPCLPKEFVWTGLQCKCDGVGCRIISL